MKASRARQLDLSDAFKARREHGGSIRKGKRKEYRPIDPKRALHIVFKSERASGHWSLLRQEAAVKRLLHSTARRYGVRVYRYANGGNHLHFLAKGPNRKDIQNFLRVATGKIAQLITGAKKGLRKGRFWTQLAYSRVVEWGRDFTNAQYYVLRNELETLGILFHSDRKLKRPAPE